MTGHVRGAVWSGRRAQRLQRPASSALPAAPVGALVEHGLLFDSIDASAAVYASPPYVLQWCPEIGGAGQMVGSRTVADTLRAFPPRPATFGVAACFNRVAGHCMRTGKFDALAFQPVRQGSHRAPYFSKNDSLDCERTLFIELLFNF